MQHQILIFYIQKKRVEKVKKYFINKFYNLKKDFTILYIKSHLKDNQYI